MKWLVYLTLIISALYAQNKGVINGTVVDKITKQRVPLLI